MLRRLNANSTTYYADAISKSNGSGDIEKRDKLLPTLQNLLSIKNAATEINISKRAKKIPFNVDLLIDIAEAKEDLLASIKLLKGRLDQEESLLSKNRLYYDNTLHRLKSKLIATLSQCNRNTFRINNKIPHAKDKVHLYDSAHIPQEYDDFITEASTGTQMTLNNCLMYTRERAKQAKAHFEAQTTQLHNAFTTAISDTQQSIGDINNQITELNSAMEQQRSCADEALYRVDSSRSHKGVISNLKSILKQVKKQEKYSHIEATASKFSPRQTVPTDSMSTANIVDITAAIKTNQSLNATTLHHRQPVVYTLIKTENEAMLTSLTQHLGKDAISNELKHDIIHELATLRSPAGDALSHAEICTKLNEILGVMYNAITTSPALINEGQYMALAQKLALAHNAKEPNRIALFTQVQEILGLTPPVSALSSEKINTLIRYLTHNDPHDS